MQAAPLLRKIAQAAALAATLVATAGVAGQAEPPGTAATKPNPAYPLRIRVLSQGGRVHNQFGTHGFGRADLMGTPIRGMDYAFDCYTAFLHNGPPDEFYQGKWKKPDQEIEILVQRVGSDHIDKCTIKVTLKSQPYGVYRAGQTATPPATVPVP
jgi:hypothetical protein